MKIGEAVEGEKIGAEWKDFLASLPAGRVELLARAVKDILADTGDKGMLNYIIRNLRTESGLTRFLSRVSRRHEKTPFP